MQIVIEIPEHVYEHAKEMSEDSRDEGEAMRAIAKGSPQESCGDAISRQAVLDAFWKLNIELSPTAIWTIQNMVKDVPSVTPQQRTGRWIYHYGHIPYKNECSECGKRFGTDTNYCPNCGCAMKGELE